MAYQTSENIDKDKIFIVNKSEITTRIDPYYNKPMFSAIWHKLSSISIPVTSIKDNSQYIFSGITPKSKGDAYVLEQGIPFVRSGDFSENNEIDFSSLLLLREDIHNGIMRGSQLKKGDLLIAIVGATIGKIGVYQYDVEANINQAICGVRLKNTLNPYYVQAFYQTNIGQKIIDRIKRPVARANINLEEVGNLPIPFLDSYHQNEVVKVMQEARHLKLQKEAEAQQLLDCIDDYLLNELGIKSPDLGTNIENRIFYIHKKDCTTRFDPKYNKQITFINSLSCHYQWEKLKDVAITTGQYGANESAIDFKDGDVRYVRITDINEFGDLKEYDKKTAKFIDKSYLLQIGDILFARSGSVGRCYIHREDRESAIFAGYLIRYKLNTKKINPWYLFFYCNSIIYKYWINTIQRPAVQANINAEEYRTLPIPLPSLTKQNEIVNHIANIRNKAKALQQEGKTILEKAKQSVEKIIIG